MKGFTRWTSTICAAARQFALTLAMAGAGQAQAQAIPEDGWARISPNAGYGFGFYMELARSQASAGAAPNKYDLLYSDQAPGVQSVTTHREAGNRSTTAPKANPPGDPVLSNLGNDRMMTLALGLNDAVPMMVFTGAVSNGCMGRYSCEPQPFHDVPVSHR